MLSMLLAVLVTGQDCQQAQSLGVRAYEERRYEEAARHFGRAATVCDGNTSSLLLALAQAQLLAKRPADALRTLDKVPFGAADFVVALKVAAKAHYLLGRDKDAEAALIRASQRAPADPEIPYDLGRIYYQQGRHAEAADSFRRAVALDERAYKAWDNLGLASEALGDVAAAQGHYLKALALVHTDHPGYDVVYANLADLMLKLGEHQRAFDLAAEAAQRNPDEPRNLFLAGKALVQLGRSDLAAGWFERAIVLDPDYPEPYYLLAQAFRKLGRTADADRTLKAFQAASARAPAVRR